MAVVSAPFYLDWTFWAFAASAVAIILSQLPPIAAIIIPPVIKVRVSDSVNLNHHLGFPNINLMLSVHNAGRRIARIKKLSAEFTRDGKPLVTIPLRNFFLNQESARSVVIFPFHLGGNYEWVHRVHGFPFITRDEDREARKLVAAMKKEVRDEQLALKRRNRKPPVDGIPLSTNLADQAHDIFKRNFIWLPGDYEMRIIVDCTGFAEEPEAFRFTLFESDAAELREYTEEYNMGRGVAFDPTFPLTGINLDLKPLITR